MPAPKQVTSAPASPARELWRMGRSVSDTGVSTSPVSVSHRFNSGRSLGGANPFRPGGLTGYMAKQPESLELPVRAQSSNFLHNASASAAGVNVKHAAAVNGSSSRGNVDALQMIDDRLEYQIRAYGYGNEGLNGARVPNGVKRCAYDDALCSPRQGLQDDHVTAGIGDAPLSSPRGSKQYGQWGNVDAPFSPRGGMQGSQWSNGDAPSSPGGGVQNSQCGHTNGEALCNSPRAGSQSNRTDNVDALGSQRDTAGGTQSGAHADDVLLSRTQQSVETGPRMVNRLKSALAAERTARMVEKERLMELERKVTDLEQELHMEFRRRETAEILLSEFRRRIRAESQVVCTCRPTHSGIVPALNAPVEKKSKRYVDGVHGLESPRVSPREGYAQRPQLQSERIGPQMKIQNTERGERRMIAASPRVCERREEKEGEKQGGETAPHQAQVVLKGKAEDCEQEGEHELGLGLQTEPDSWDAIATTLKQNAEKRMSMGGRMREAWQHLGKEMGSMAETWAEEEDVLMKNVAWLAQSLQRLQDDLQQAHERTTTLVAVNEWQAEQLRGIHQQRLDAWCHGMGMEKHPVPTACGAPLLGLADHERGRLRAILDCSQTDKANGGVKNKKRREGEGAGGGATVGADLGEGKGPARAVSSSGNSSFSNNGVTETSDEDGRNSTSVPIHPRMPDLPLNVISLAAAAAADVSDKDNDRSAPYICATADLCQNVAHVKDDESAALNTAGKSQPLAQSASQGEKLENAGSEQRKGGSDRDVGEDGDRHHLPANGTCPDVSEICMPPAASAEASTDSCSLDDRRECVEPTGQERHSMSGNVDGVEAPKAEEKKPERQGAEQGGLCCDGDVCSTVQSRSDGKRRPKSLVVPVGRQLADSSAAVAVRALPTASSPAEAVGGGRALDGDTRANLGGMGMDGVPVEGEAAAGNNGTDVVLRALTMLQREMRQALAQDFVRQQQAGGSYCGSNGSCTSPVLAQPSVVWSSSEGPQLYYTSFPPSPSSTSTDSRDTCRPSQSSYYQGGVDSQASATTAGTYLLPNPLPYTGRGAAKVDMAMPPDLDSFLYANSWVPESDPMMVLPPRLYFGS